MNLLPKPISLAEANKYVEDNHRHHNPVYRDKYRISAWNSETNSIVGIVQVGRPVNRVLDDGETLEIVRLCTDGTKNVCSFLISKASRIAKEMGYKRMITYILCSETGDSLKASGWTFHHVTQAKEWNCPSRPRKTKAPSCSKQCWIKKL